MKERKYCGLKLIGFHKFSIFIPYGDINFLTTKETPVEEIAEESVEEVLF
ncbi:hypothetical protein S7335_5263 [Synechococcus sp. PCC 7335]|nr:hypothetical protein S7335_5263 [Synechococcus sp. PCC 7335]